VRSPRKGWKPKILSYSQFKFWLRFEGDCDPGGFTSLLLQDKSYCIAVNLEF